MFTITSNSITSSKSQLTRGDNPSKQMFCGKNLIFQIVDGGGNLKIPCLFYSKIIHGNIL